MQTKSRYILVFFIFVWTCLFFEIYVKYSAEKYLPLSFYDSHVGDLDFHLMHSQSQCLQNFSVSIADLPAGAPYPSKLYSTILENVKQSPYFVRFDVSQPLTCQAIVVSWDTLDRDNASNAYVKLKKFQPFPYNSSVVNYLVFNLYTGNFPDYSARLDKAFKNVRWISRASSPLQELRRDNDISIPLFTSQMPSKLFSKRKKKLLASFKGKRYLFGVGIFVRSSFYRIDDGKRIIMLTTCRHGLYWFKYTDARCSKDNAYFERYDYDDLLNSSTFCIVPRGRRLGSFRFLEVLAHGCIPVIMANDWDLPFSEVIDWKEASIQIDERLTPVLPIILRSYSYETILQLQERGRLIYSLYFSSIRKIIHTTLEIIRGRFELRPLSKERWNSSPGALLFPFTRKVFDSSEAGYSVVINVTKSSRLSALTALIQQAITANYSVKVIVLCGLHCYKLSFSSPKVFLVSSEFRAVSYHSVDSLLFTNAILRLDASIKLSSEEMDFAYLVWKEFPSRLVGYLTRLHFYDKQTKRWSITSRPANLYSLILPAAIMYHRDYHSMLKRFMPQLPDPVRVKCQSLLLNLLAAEVTDGAPIKLCDVNNLSAMDVNMSSVRDNLANCLNLLHSEFIDGSVNLKYSKIRLNPVLYRDDVSILKKRYRFIDYRRS